MSLLFLAEKNWSRGVGLTRVVGTAMVVLGLAVVLNPDVLPGISGASADVVPMDGATMGTAR